MTHSFFPYKWGKVIFWSRKVGDGGGGEPAGKEEQEFVERRKLEVCGRTAVNSGSSGIQVF